MNQPSGRHRRPSRSLAEQVWRLAATLIAAALTYVFVPQTARRQNLALGPAPERLRLPTARTTSTEPARFAPPSDEDPGALVRPYMPPYPPPIPRPRLPEGDLLAAPKDQSADDFGELTAAIRTWLAVTGGADRP